MKTLLLTNNGIELIRRIVEVLTVCSLKKFCKKVTILIIFGVFLLAVGLHDDDIMNPLHFIGSLIEYSCAYEQESK